MLLFRAINEQEEKVLNLQNDIFAPMKQYHNFLGSASQHVANASNKNYSTYWISTSKDFHTCAAEFSIPQMGGYNTAKKEKTMIVIDAMAWRGHNPSYINNQNYTIFLDKNRKLLVDLGDSTQYPIPKIQTTKGGKNYWSINGKRIFRNDINNQIQYFTDIVDKQDAELGLLDLSFYTSKRLHPLQRFSLMDFLHWGLCVPCKGQPIAYGCATSHREVLVLNSIPYSFISYQLSTLEKEVLYALPPTVFDNELQRIINGSLKITYQNNSIFVSLNTTKQIVLSPQEQFVMSGFLVDLACYEALANHSNLVQEYDKLKKEKRVILNKVLQAINFTYQVNKLLEDEVFVQQVEDLNASEIVVQLPSYANLNAEPSMCRKYDLLAVQDSNTGVIEKYSDSNYAKTFKRMKFIRTRTF